MKFNCRQKYASRGTIGQRVSRPAHRFSLLIAGMAVIGTCQIASAQLTDPVLYREIFPNSSGANQNLNSSTNGDTGWRLLAGSQGQDFTAFQSLVSGGRGAATNSALGGPGGTPPPPGTVLQPVNSNPSNVEISRGYVMNTFSGGNWSASQLYYTTEYAIDRSAFDVTRVAWTQASLAGSGTSTNTPDTTRVALRVGTSWFVSEQTFTAAREPFAMEFWAVESQGLNLSGAQWLPLSLSPGVTMSVGTVAQSLPSGGNITGLGLWWDKMSERGGFDGFTVRGKAATVNATWGLSGGGDWAVAANWAGGAVPNASGATASFGASITGPSTINLDSAVTVGAINFDNASFSYRVDGTGTIALAGGASKISVTSGQHAIAVPVTLPATSSIEVAAGSQLSIRHLRGGALTIRNGAVKIISGADSTGKLASLTFEAGGTLDLAGSALIVDYGAAAPSPYAAVLAEAQSGKLSDSTLGQNLSLAVVDNVDLNLTTFRGLDADSSSVLVRAALNGDADLDNTVNFNDLLVLAANYNTLTGGRWAKGDFTGDGATDFDDLLRLAANYNTSIPGGGPAGWALAQATVPEPTTVVAAMAPAIGLLRRRFALRRPSQD